MSIRILLTILGTVSLLISASRAQLLPTGVTTVPFYDTKKAGLSFAVDQQSVVGMWEVPGKPGHFLVLGYFGFVWSLYPDMSKAYAPGAIKDYSKKQLADFNRKVRKGWEQGALGASFDPDFAGNRFFYIIYNKYEKESQYRTGFKSIGDGDGAGSNGLISIERWRLSENLATLTLDTTLFLAEHGTGYGSANMVFGKDGYLYITCDAYSKNSWDSTDYMRKVLRIDVSKRDPGRLYAIPTSNPFYNAANPAVKKEIFAFGFRNTYSLTADYLTGSIWGAEVGQSTWEEINIIKSGRNYGWADGGDGQKNAAGESYRFGVGIEGPCSNNTPSGGAFNETYKAPYSFTGPQSQGRKYTCEDFTNGAWSFSHPGAPIGGIPTAVPGLTINCIMVSQAFRGDPLSPFYGYHFVTDVNKGYFVAVKEGVAAATAVGGLSPDITFCSGCDKNHNGITSFGEDSYGNMYVTLLSSRSTGPEQYHDIYRIFHKDMKPLATPRTQVFPTRIAQAPGKAGSARFNRLFLAGMSDARLRLPAGFTGAALHSLDGRLLWKGAAEPGASASGEVEIRVPGGIAEGPVGIRYLGTGE